MSADTPIVTSHPTHINVATHVAYLGKRYTAQQQQQMDRKRAPVSAHFRKIPAPRARFVHDGYFAKVPATTIDINCTK